MPFRKFTCQVLAGKSADAWHPPAFTPVIKVHDFKLATALALS